MYTIMASRKTRLWVRKILDLWLIVYINLGFFSHILSLPQVMHVTMGYTSHTIYSTKNIFCIIKSDILKLS